MCGTGSCSRLLQSIRCRGLKSMEVHMLLGCWETPPDGGLGVGIKPSLHLQCPRGRLLAKHQLPHTMHCPAGCTTGSSTRCTCLRTNRAPPQRTSAPPSSTTAPANRPSPDTGADRSLFCHEEKQNFR